MRLSCGANAVFGLMRSLSMARKELVTRIGTVILIGGATIFLFWWGANMAGIAN